MSDSIPAATDSGNVPRREPERRLTMQSFRWPLADRAEIAPCPDCAHWHAIVEDDSIPGECAPDLYLREWHEADCPCWGDAH